MVAFWDVRWIKQRIRVWHAATRSSTTKFLLVIIERSKCPSAFQKKFSQELGYDCHAFSKAWMTRVLFFSWLLLFSAYIQKFFLKKVPLLFDNCTAYGCADDLPALLNLNVRFSPLNTTSGTQPCDSRIISCMKTLHKWKLITRVLDNIDVSVKDIYSVNILTAMGCITDL